MKGINGIILLILLALISCEKSGQKEIILTPKGHLVAHSECKKPMQLKNSQVDADTISCIEYSYDDNAQILSLRHINAGFNCCPDSLYCVVKTSLDTIYIQEFEQKQGCRCDCLYDLDIRLEGIEAKKYTIVIKEPYCNEMEKLILCVDLNSQPSGRHCVTRFNYPWGE